MSGLLSTLNNSLGTQQIPSSHAHLNPTSDVLTSSLSNGVSPSIHQAGSMAGDPSQRGVSPSIKKEDSNVGEDGAPRSGRACLACRKLKTKCEGADDPPCKRCRLGSHECIFVESKRGKRPARKPTDQSLAEKFRTVEKTLSLVLQSMNSGSPPDPAALHQLQASLADGIAGGNAAALAAAAGLSSSHNGDKDHAAMEGTSPSSGSDGGSILAGSTSSYPPHKRARQASSTSTNRYAGAAGARGITHSPTMSDQLSQTLSPMTQSQHLAGMTPSSNDSPRSTTAQLQRSSIASPRVASTSNTVGTAVSPGTSGTPSAPGNSLSLLADASLAAEIGGRTKLTGLDPSFKLSSVTFALVNDEDSQAEADKTPALLSKGVVDAETAVELFRIFFDYAYIHLPLLDPSHNTATAVCARSPFLFTVICAVASRFHSDPTLHVRCYDEAHNSFVNCVSKGESSIESVQACIILTVWTNAPKKTEDRPQRAWLYFGSAVRMALELGLFRPPAFVDAHLARNASKANPWANLKEVATEEEQREALNRERTWLMVFIVDRNMSAVMGRPYQIQETKPLLIPQHPMCLPFDLGVIAHQELQAIIGQVMDTFRERIYGLSSASDEMPSPMVMKLFNSRMDEWQNRWCPVAGEPIANILLFYFYSSKLFLNTIPLHTMLRNGDAIDDPECVSSTINSAKSILELGHKYAELGVLRHCPDVNFLLLVYAAVFLTKVKASNSRFAQLVDSDELQTLMLQSIHDCQAATCSSKHAASTCMIILRALYASWKAMAAGGVTGTVGAGSSGGTRSRAGGPEQEQQALDHTSNGGAPSRGLAPDGSSDPFGPPSAGLGLQGTLSGGLPMSPAPYSYATSPFSSNPPGYPSHPSARVGATGSGTHTPNLYANGASYNPLDPLDNFLNDTHFFDSVLVSQGADGFFSWPDSALDLGAIEDLEATLDERGYTGFGNMSMEAAQ